MEGARCDQRPACPDAGHYHRVRAIGSCVPVRAPPRASKKHARGSVAELVAAGGRIFFAQSARGRQLKAGVLDTPTIYFLESID